jgi:adenylate cyclase
MRQFPTARDNKRPTAIAAGFRDALMIEILRTELIRIRTLIATTSILVAILWAVYLFSPDALNNIWRGHLKADYLYIILVPFILFEWWVSTVVRRHLRSGGDIPVWRRYVGAFIETSMPTLALALHIDNMGAVQALSFVVPLAYFIFIILSTLRLDFWLSAFTGAVAAVELFLMAMFYHPAGFDGAPPDVWFHLARSLIIVICGVLAGAVGVQLRKQFESSIAAATARDQVTNLFGQHVSPQVVEFLLTSRAEVTSEIRHVTVMFVDFRSFTAASRDRPPEQVVARLDSAFAKLVEILDRHGGIVNKFLGDGFLALFGTPIDQPDSALRAVNAARDMVAAMTDDGMEAEWPLRIGIGIHLGPVVVGNVGSARRKEYTVIGDTVNLAARIESLNKEFGSQLLISSAVRDAIGADGERARSLGAVAVRGYEQPVAIWQLD